MQLLNVSIEALLKWKASNINGLLLLPRNNPPLYVL